MMRHSRWEVEKLDTPSRDSAATTFETTARSERLGSRPSPFSVLRIHKAVRAAGKSSAEAIRKHGNNFVIVSQYICVFQGCPKSTSDRGLGTDRRSCFFNMRAPGGPRSLSVGIACRRRHRHVQSVGIASVSRSPGCDAGV